MPQHKQLAWAQLRVGLLAIVSLALLTVGVFLISGQVGFFAKKITLYTLVPDSGGLKTGAPVRLTGIDVGSVHSIGISGLEDINQAVKIVMEVTQEHQSEIHTDSEAFIVAEGLLGERYINISKGTAKSPAVSAGATIRFHETAEFSELVGGSRDLLDNLNVLTTRLNSVVGKIESGEGTISQLITKEDLYRKIDTTVDDLQHFAAQLSEGKGSLGKLMASDELYQHLDTTLLKLQDFADKLQNGQGTVGKLINDPSLYNKADEMVSRGNTLLENINQGHGTIGKLTQDEALYQQLRTTVSDLDSILAGLKNGEGAMGRLLHDTTLYDNLNSTSVEVRELLADFRHNPKKFLTIHFKIF